MGLGANVNRMSFQLPDPISCFADFVTIFSIWIVYFQTRQAWKELKKARAPLSVGHGCLEFGHFDYECAINLVPLTEATAIPRVGDTIFLPGETRGEKNLGRGLYKVEDVIFRYREAPDEVDQPCPALPSRIVVRVRSLNSE